jgi:hypothetical protein
MIALLFKYVGYLTVEDGYREYRDHEDHEEQVKPCPSSVLRIAKWFTPVYRVYRAKGAGVVDGEVEYVHFRLMFLCSQFLRCENVRYWQSSKLSSSQGGAAGACERPNMHCCQKKAEHGQSLLVLALGEKCGLSAQQFLCACVRDWTQSDVSVELLRKVCRGCAYVGACTCARVRYWLEPFELDAPACEF